MNPSRRSDPIVPVALLGCLLSLPVGGWADPAPDAGSLQSAPQEVEVARLKAERDLLRSEVERLRAAMDDAERSQLIQQSAEADARSERLDTRLASLLELSHAMEAERSVLRAELGEMRTRAESAESRAQRMLQERETALETNLALQAQKREAETRLETEMQRVADQLLQIEALQADLVAAHEAVRTLDAQRAEAHVRAEELERRIDECVPAEPPAEPMQAPTAAEPPAPAGGGE